MAGNSVVNKMECPEGKYYDSGVDNCESCDDYCLYTNLPSFVKLCEQNCPKVYKQLMDSQKQPVPTEFLSDDTPSASDHSGFPVAGIIALALVGTVAIVSILIVGIVVYKKKTQNQNQNQRRQRTTENRSECRYSGVEEENGEQAESERLSQGEGLLSSMCDPRVLLRGVGMQETGQEGRNEMALIGSSQESNVSQTSHPKAYAVTQSPIYKPSGYMHSAPTRV